MRHAILVEGHGNNAEVLQETIRILDDAEIDFGFIGINVLKNLY